jgi:hypothetical protein
LEYVFATTLRRLSLCATGYIQLASLAHPCVCGICASCIHQAEDVILGLPDRAMVRSAWYKTPALLVDDMSSHEPIWQWVLCIAHLPPCPAGGRKRDVYNEHPLVIQKIHGHLNTKNDEVVEYYHHKKEHRLR